MNVRKIMLIFVGIFVVTAATLLVIGVVTHEEPGLLTGCPMTDGRIDYAGTCRNVEWRPEAFPLKIAVTTTNPNPPNDPGDALESAVSLVNSRLGFEAFQIIEWGPRGARVVVRIGEAAGVDTNGVQDPHGSVSHQSDGVYVSSAELITRNTGTAEMLDKVLIHELGHVLGLDHDPFESSAMFPRQTPDVARLSRPRITDYDRDLLRGLYADR